MADGSPGLPAWLLLRKSSEVGTWETGRGETSAVRKPQRQETEKVSWLVTSRALVAVFDETQ